MLAHETLHGQRVRGGPDALERVQVGFIVNRNQNSRQARRYAVDSVLSTPRPPTPPPCIIRKR